MEKSIGVTQARDQFKTIVDAVQHHGDKYVLNRHGKPAVVVVPMEVYESWKKQRQRLLALIHEVQEGNLEADPDEVMAEVLAAQRAIRAQKAILS
jgi:prevent-host-death family protein